MTKIDTQPEALRLAHYFDQPLPPEWEDMKAAAAELRRLHAELERVTNNRDMWKDQCAAQAQQIAQDRADAARAVRVIDAARVAMDEGEDALDTINVPSHHAAALSIALDDYDAFMTEKTP